jgi:hypothetical protein
MPTSPKRKKPQSVTHEPREADEYDPPSIGKRIQAIAGALIAILIVLSMLIGAIFPFFF